MKPWKLIKAEETALDQWQNITRKTFLKPDGEERPFNTWGGTSQKAGAVIALTPDNRLVVSEQFRPGPNKIYFDLPGGLAESGENPKDAAMREFLEETGYTSDDVEFLGASHWTAYENLESHHFLARNCKKVSDQKLDPAEFINVKLITIDELIANAMNDRMCDKAAILFAYEKLKKIQEGL